MLLNLLFPRNCYLCKKPGLYFCTSCQKKLPVKKHQYCPVCVKKTLLGYTHTFCQHRNNPELSISLFDYQEPIRSALHDLKHRFVSDLAKEFSLLTINQLKRKHKDILTHWQKQNFILLPVPLHRQRRNYRGFNQTEILGKLIAKNLKLQYKNLLIRSRPTRPQYKLSKKERLQNLKKAFSFSSTEKPVPQNYLLFDDIFTTGTTLSACCRVLKQNKALNVHLLTLAR